MELILSLTLIFCAGFSYVERWILETFLEKGLCKVCETQRKSTNKTSKNKIMPLTTNTNRNIIVSVLQVCDGRAFNKVFQEY